MRLLAKVIGSKLFRFSINVSIPQIQNVYSNISEKFINFLFQFILFVILINNISNLIFYK